MNFLFTIVIDRYDQNIMIVIVNFDSNRTESDFIAMKEEQSIENNAHRHISLLWYTNSWPQSSLT